MTVLVTGGAGYIGAHIVQQLQRSAFDVVVVDDLSTGFAERITAPIVKMNIASDTARDSLRAVMLDHQVDSVIHLASHKRVPESVDDPLKYWSDNIRGVLNLAEAAAEHSLKGFVFSSSAAVYGDVVAPQVAEDSATVPVNPYGSTKLAGEWIVRDVLSAANVPNVSLRYFNVAGASDPILADRFELNLVSMVLAQLHAGRAPEIFGDDYPTEDGTCIRDFIHVDDIASAHVAALRALLEKRSINEVYNLGTGHGHSVAEVVRLAIEVTGSNLVPNVSGRRQGDPAAVVADPQAAQQHLDWMPTRSLDDMIRSAWLRWES